MVKRWRDEWERIVRMQNVRRFSSQQHSKFSKAFLIPDRPYANLDRAHSPNCVVVRQVLRHLMTSFCQQLIFGAARLILAAGMLIEVMDLQNLHGTDLPLNCAEPLAPYAAIIAIGS
jgi:hypothetical protein